MLIIHLTRIWYLFELMDFIKLQFYLEAPDVDPLVESLNESLYDPLELPLEARPLNLGC